MPSIDFEVERLYYSISEVADMLGVNQSLIRFWEKEFEQLTPKKNMRGNRQFTKRDIDVLKRIYHLVKEKGFTLEGAKKSMRVRTPAKEQNAPVVKRLQTVRDQLKAILHSL